MRFPGVMVLLLSLPLSGAEPVDYLREIKPLLAARCYACHGALKQKSDLRVDTVAALIRGGAGGPVVRPGKPEQSPLLARVASSDEEERMPPEGEPLSPEQIALLRRWIAQGAPRPRQESAEPDPRDHWAFQPPVRPALPASGPPHPIDRFLHAEQRKRGLVPVPEAPPELWIRRAYLDLLGYPPSAEEMDAFLADTRPGAFERLVDRLLSNPAYGERWGRHWMDVWRYSDWYGLGEQLRNSQKHLWHWRDWIVESLNENRPYDQMIREMIAGDELSPENPSVVRATGFLARNYYLFNRNTWLEETVEHTFKAFTGLTVQCAKCHDHKFDPISQADYYRLRAFFEPHQVRLDPVPGQSNLDKNGLPRVFDLHLEAPTYLLIRGDEKRPDTNRVISPAVPALLSFSPLEIRPVPLPPAAYAPSTLPFVEEDHLREAEASVDSARRQLNALLQKKRELEAPGPEPEGPALPDAPATLHAGGLVSSEWSPGPGAWMFADQGVTQSERGASRLHLRWNRELPRDFTVRLRFTLLGGVMWKSAGLAFDAAEGRDVLVYASAFSGSKVQVAYREEAADYTYPPEAAVARPVPVGEAIELRVTVCGRTVNVAYNGEHQLAWRLPKDRRPGALELVAFDAEVAFSELHVEALGAESHLIEPGTGRRVAARELRSPRTGELQQTAEAAEVSAHAVRAAERRREYLRAAFAADRARFTGGSPEAVSKASAAAARAEAEWKLAQAVEERLKAAQSLSRNEGGPKAAEARKTLESAEAALEKARAAAASPGEAYTSPRVARKAFEGPTETESSLPAHFPETSTGRRTALALWLTDRRNPLTARVAVNQIWMRHFGEPLAPEVFDLGRKNPPPPLQPLLDWLAVEFMESGWDQKRMHRLMMTSALYRRASSTRAAKQATRTADPDNHFWWRRGPLRLDAHALRDSMLRLGDRLDQRMGGPTLDPRGQEHALRRSLYFNHSLEENHRFLETFDNAKVLECYRRLESIVPQQALALANSRLAMESARHIAAKLGSQEDFITAAFRTVIGRRPTPEERQACVLALAEWEAAAQGGEPAATARVHLVHTLLNHNDFITLR